MLVLTRKVGQALVIGDNITVTVVSIEQGKVRVGVTAPREVRVDRREVHERRALHPLVAPPVSAAVQSRKAGVRRSRLVIPSLP